MEDWNNFICNEKQRMTVPLNFKSENRQNPNYWEECKELLDLGNSCLSVACFRLTNYFKGAFSRGKKSASIPNCKMLHLKVFTESFQKQFCLFLRCKKRPK